MLLLLLFLRCRLLLLLIRDTLIVVDAFDQQGPIIQDRLVLGQGVFHAFLVREINESITSVFKTWLGSLGALDSLDSSTLLEKSNNLPLWRVVVKVAHPNTVFVFVSTFILGTFSFFFSLLCGWLLFLILAYCFSSLDIYMLIDISLLFFSV